MIGLQKFADELAVGIVLSKCRTDQVIKLAEVTSIESELSAVQISLQERHVYTSYCHSIFYFISKMLDNLVLTKFVCITVQLSLKTSSSNRFGSSRKL